MLPFCSCSGTGPQVTRMRLELMASAVTFSGAPDGTTQTEKDKSHSLIALCLNTRPRVLSKLTWISHLSNVIREKRKQTALRCEQQTRVWAWGDSEQTTKRRQTFNTRPYIRQHSQPRTSLRVGYYLHNYIMTPSTDNLHFLTTVIQVQPSKELFILKCAISDPLVAPNGIAICLSGTTWLGITTLTHLFIHHLTNWISLWWYNLIIQTLEDGKKCTF